MGFRVSEVRVVEWLQGRCHWENGHLARSLQRPQLLPRPPSRPSVCVRGVSSQALRLQARASRPRLLPTAASSHAERVFSSAAPPPAGTQPLQREVLQATTRCVCQPNLQCSCFAFSSSHATRRVASFFKFSGVESLTTTKCARAAFSATGICAASLASACAREYPRVRIIRSIWRSSDEAIAIIIS